MSTYWVNSAYTSFGTLDESPYYLIDVRQNEETFFIDTRDILSDPSVETMFPSGAALWPRGAAWGSPDGFALSATSVLAGFLRALLTPFGALYRRLWQLTDESRASTIIDSLADWERDYGLPDKCLVNEQTEEERRLRLRVKVRSEGTISPADFVRLAASIGVVVALEEPDAFLAGESECGSFFEVSNIALEQQWVVHVLDAPVSYFEVGVGEAGVTRLLDFDSSAIECLFDQLAPAWTYPVYSYGEILLPVLLVTDGGVRLGTEEGHPLIAFTF